MSDDSDHTIATATVASEETPYGVRRVVRAGVEIRTVTRAVWPVATHATEPPTQGGVLIP
jgi:hypothetical protein